MNKKLTGILFLLFFTPSIFAAALPRESSVPGGIAIVQLQTKSQPRPQVSYLERPVMVQANDTHWLAVIGIPLAAETGKHQIKITQAGNTRTASFMVGDKAYRTQHLTIKNKRKVNPSQKDLQRIIRERDQIRNALKHWRKQDDVIMEFVPPVKGRMSSSFGLRRFFNDQPRKPHSGMDIAAVTGTPIRAPGPGTVIETGDFFFNGKSVFLDHGQGLVTMYGHMDSIRVKKGQQVETGALLGTVGKTGRVTGAHLHWGISLNNARVDPALFLKQTGK